MATRKEQFDKLFPNQPKFRWQQIERALFNPAYKGWEDVMGLPKNMREAFVGVDNCPPLQTAIPWMSLHERLVLHSKSGDTHKAALEASDGKLIESVLMKNMRDQWTICVSSQVGCAMNCSFCATGKMGFSRNLTSDEIIDQYRFWMYWLKKNPTIQQRISNVVFMGMGEPLANYENVKKTIQTWVKYTDIGPTHITVSTVGVLPILEKILTDPEWPHARLAVSLHSADLDTRKSIVPTSHPEFLDKLADWAKRYLQKYGNRRHHLTFEHIMLSGVNDTDEHAQQLTRFSNRVGHVRINLIPYNFVGDIPFRKSTDVQLERFTEYLKTHGVLVTVRRTMGDDIAAACGQLAMTNN